MSCPPRTVELSPDWTDREPNISPEGPRPKPPDDEPPDLPGKPVTEPPVGPTERPLRVC